MIDTFGKNKNFFHNSFLPFLLIASLIFFYNSIREKQTEMILNKSNLNGMDTLSFPRLVWMLLLLSMTAPMAREKFCIKFPDSAEIKAEVFLLKC